jgi:hypothetical protein
MKLSKTIKPFLEKFKQISFEINGGDIVLRLARYQDTVDRTHRFRL